MCSLLYTYQNFHICSCSDFIENWVHYMQATGCKAYLVGENERNWRCVCRFLA